MSLNILLAATYSASDCSNPALEPLIWTLRPPPLDPSLSASRALPAIAFTDPTPAAPGRISAQSGVCLG